MARGASAHFFLKRTDYEAYYPLALGVLQNSGFLIAHAKRADDRALVKAIPRTEPGSGVELEVRRRPKGVDVHLLVVPHEDLLSGPDHFLMQQGTFAFLHKDAASSRVLADLLPALRRHETERRTDPHFARTPTNIPEWIFFNLRGGAVTWFLGTVLGTTAAAYILFWAPDGAYRTNDLLIAALLLVLAPWWSGIWARSAARGFVAGFVTVLIPLALYVVAARGWGLSVLLRPPGIPIIESLLTQFGGTLGLVVPIILGLLSAVPGTIAGVVGGRIFPTEMKHARPSEPI